MSSNTPENTDTKEYHKKEHRSRRDYFQKYYHAHRQQIISRSIMWSLKFKETNQELYRLKNATIYSRNREKVCRKKREAYRKKKMENLHVPGTECRISVVGSSRNVTLTFD